MNFDETMINRLKTLERQVERLKGSEKIDAYPVGSIYMSVASTDPGTLFGGTWAAWGAGRVPVSKAASGTFATVESTGGAETHVLTNAEMRYHTYGNIGGGGVALGVHDHDVTASAHNNLQPYIVCYMFKRLS